MKKRKKKGAPTLFCLSRKNVCLFLSSALRAPRLRLLLLLLDARGAGDSFQSCAHMSSARLSGLSANAGSGSDDDDEANRSTRSVVVAIEKTEDGLSAVKFAAENVLKGEVRQKEKHRERF
jgi:hypothetical protein